MTFYKVGDIVKEKKTGRVSKIMKANSYVNDIGTGKVEYELRLNGNNYYLSAFDVEEATEKEAENYTINEVKEAL